LKEALQTDAAQDNAVAPDVKRAARLIRAVVMQQ
jgi:hypothetical protein